MFVLLEHRTDSGVHWDLMIEQAEQERLATWRLAQNPAVAGRGAIAAEPIGDHRRIYLDYQGDLSDGRGTVTRVDRGDSRWLSRGAGRVVVELSGRSLRGTFRIGQTERAACEFAEYEEMRGDG